MFVVFFDSKFFAEECHNFWKALDSVSDDRLSLTTSFSHVRSFLKDCIFFPQIQQLVTGTQKNTDMCQSVLEKIDNFISTCKFLDYLTFLQKLLD